MRRLKGIIELAIALALVGLIVWTNVIPDEGRRLEDSIYVDDAQVLPENEGKRIIIAGPVVVQEEAVDPDLDISFGSLVARRSVERLRYRDGWEWESVSEWSTSSNLTDATFAGKARIGQFELDDKLVKALPTGERDWAEDDLDAQTRARLLEQWYENYDGGQLYLSQLSTFAMDWEWPLYQELEGSYRVRYRVRNPDDEKVTVVGIQRGSTLCFDEDLNASSTFEGTPDLDEMVSSDKRAALIGEIIFAGIPALILIVLGVINVRDN